MKRLRNFLLNLVLIFVSVMLAYYFLRVCDWGLGLVPFNQLFPGPMGLIFQPGTEDHWETHDYSHSEYINALGFRDTAAGKQVPLKKTCKYRVVAIGDSFTYGWGVNIEDTWCKLLERNLRQQGMDIEILNLGKPAAGPDEYATIAETAIPVLKPDLVLIGCLAGDDLQQVGFDVRPWLQEKFSHFLRLIRYVHNRRTYQSPQAPSKRTVADNRKMSVDCAKDLVRQMKPEQKARLDAIEEPVKQVFYAGMLNPWLLAHSTGNPDYFMSTLTLEDLGLQVNYTAWAFARIQRVAQRYNTRVTVVSIPEGFYVNKEAFKNVQRIGFHVVPEMLTCSGADDGVRTACESAGLGFHSVTDGFRKHIDETGLYFELDRHMSAAGNALYAELIAPLIAEDIGDAAKPSTK